MALTDVRPFFRTRMDGLGFSEHLDGFNTANVAETVFDDSFHIESGVVTVLNDPEVHTFTYPILVRVFRRGFSDPLSAIDALDQTREDILTDILNPALRLATTGIKNIEFVDSSVIPLDDSNDNSMILEMNFNAIVILCFN